MRVITKKHIITVTLPHIILSKRAKIKIHNGILKILAILSCISITTFGLLIDYLTLDGFILALMINIPAGLYLAILGYANGYTYSKPVRKTYV